VRVTAGNKRLKGRAKILTVVWRYVFQMQNVYEGINKYVYLKVTYSHKHKADKWK
jgi:hypothetical protein